MKNLMIVLVVLIVAAGGFVGGTYYGKKIQSKKAGVQTEATAVASSTRTSATQPATGTATQVSSAQGIRVTSPTKDSTISSPLKISGEATGTWYSEGQFTVSLTNANGTEIGSTVARAQGNWMTENYVPFTATIEFTVQSSKTGFLIFKKSNPSGLASNNQEYKLKVSF